MWCKFKLSTSSSHQTLADISVGSFLKHGVGLCVAARWRLLRVIGLRVISAVDQVCPRPFWNTLWAAAGTPPSCQFQGCRNARHHPERHATCARAWSRNLSGSVLVFVCLCVLVPVLGCVSVCLFLCVCVCVCCLPLCVCVRSSRTFVYVRVCVCVVVYVVAVSVCTSLSVCLFLCMCVLSSWICVVICGTIRRLEFRWS